MYPTNPHHDFSGPSPHDRCVWCDGQADSVGSPSCAVKRRIMQELGATRDADLMHSFHPESEVCHFCHLTLAAAQARPTPYCPEQQRRQLTHARVTLLRSLGYAPLNNDETTLYWGDQAGVYRPWTSILIGLEPTTPVTASLTAHYHAASPWVAQQIGVLFAELVVRPECAGLLGYWTHVAAHREEG